MFPFPSIFRHANLAVRRARMWHNNLGLTLTQSGQSLAALPHLREAVRLNPTAAQAQNNLGIALAAVGRPHEAVVAFRGALHFMPGSPSVHDNLAKALRLAGRAEEAAAAAGQAARLRAAGGLELGR